MVTHGGIGKTPAVITDCTPISVVVDLHTTLVSSVPTHQSHRELCRCEIWGSRSKCTCKRLSPGVCRWVWSVGVVSLVQATPASSSWLQLWFNSSLCSHSISSRSVPVHRTLSRRILPRPRPKYALNGKENQ